MKNLGYTHHDLHKLIEDRLGLDIHMRTAIQLEPVIQRLADGNVDEFITTLRNQSVDAPSWQHLIQELTIGETYFFRNRVQLQILKRDILPELLHRNRRTRQLMVWCAGCATGEEAYSVAMLLRETIPDAEHWNLTIVATDISKQALQVAKQGVFRDWSFRHKDMVYQQQYFKPTGDGYVLDPAIRQMVTFRQANLMDMPQHAWANLILCRNVLLYFKPQAKTQVEQSLHTSLHAGGWLLLGHAEAMQSGREKWLAHMFDGAIAYQKLVPTETHEAREQSLIHPVQGESRPNPLMTQPLRQLTVDDETQLDEQYQAAVQAYQDENHASAEQLLAAIVNQSRTHTRARVMLAAVFANRGASTEANIHLNAALRQDPLNADAHYLRSMLYLDSEQSNLAEASLRAALYSEKGHPLAAFTLGNLCAQHGNLAKAQRLWQQAIASATAMPSAQPISDFNPRTAADFVALVRSQMTQNG